MISRWNQLLRMPVVIVFDCAGSKEDFGKTSKNDKATPENLMAGKGEGLPVNPSVLINLEAGSLLITLAHELAHVIGFNPTGANDIGHFADSGKYKELEGKYGPKLLFDAYYFETLVDRISRS